MKTFEQALFELYTKGIIGEEVALAESDNPANLRLIIKQYEISRAMGNNRPSMGSQMSDLIGKPQF